MTRRTPVAVALEAIVLMGRRLRSMPARLRPGRTARPSRRRRRARRLARRRRAGPTGAYAGRGTARRRDARRAGP
ncbi:hypothetical protein [Actinokineospora sp. NPDC004072]